MAVPVEIDIGDLKNDQSVRRQYPPRLDQRVPWIFELFKTIPDKYGGRPLAGRIVTEWQLPDGASLATREGTCLAADIESNGPPAPCLRHFQKCSQVAADFQHFRAGLQKLLKMILLFGEGVAVARVQILHQHGVVFVRFVVRLLRL